jgi:hypothetical protein
VRWRLLGGASPTELVPVVEAPRTGFETTLTAPAPAAWLALQAIDAGGNVLTTTAARRG